MSLLACCGVAGLIAVPFAATAQEQAAATDNAIAVIIETKVICREAGKYGGTIGSFLYAYPFGARAFATGTAVYAPEVALAFYEHVKGGHFADAAAQVKRYEQPVTAAFAPIGHWACFHAALTLQGLFASPVMRFPMRTLKEEEVEKVRKILVSNGWIAAGK